MPLILATTPVEWLIVILQVSVGLGAVIFVHELGHFAVAKMCGVKCDKFFIGFDVGGYKISRKWGETEYGIGILPLGGYVKMLGQDDNPANIAEQVRESEASANEALETKEITGPDGTKYIVDSRSYLAKSVPQRMAIISAGVIMNVIFAFIFAVVAFGIGVPYIPCIVSQTTPGSPAWQAGIQPGDEVIQLGETENPSFTELRSGVTLGDLEDGIHFKVRRADSEQEDTLLIKPEQGPGLARVGIISPMSLRLAKEQPALADTPAADATPALAGGDEILAVGGKPVTAHHQFAAELVKHPSENLELTVRRGGKAPQGDRFGPLTGGEEITVTVGPRVMKRLGLVMEMGKIAAVQQNTAAASAGIQPGDFIDKISLSDEATETLDDPIALPEQLRQLAQDNRTVRITLRRSAAGGNGRQATEDIDLPLREVTWPSDIVGRNDPLDAPALGIAYRVLNRVAQVHPESPAAIAGLQTGDLITQAEFIPPENAQKGTLAVTKIEFDEQLQQNWPVFIQLLQALPAGTLVKLTYKRDDALQEATLAAVAAEGQFLADRGFSFQPIKRMRQAGSFGEQLNLGLRETTNSLGMVFRFLKKLGTQIPLTALGGPVTIAQAAGYSAFEGVGKLLVFLTMLSANLAVINFLPIPLLDGGHMVFLAYEGFRGRPASEKFVVALHTVGFVFIISLMLFVLGLDIGLIPRNI
ncbi:MAG: site-2 protease family protein [Planctomycetales bacterium]|nr:site-2 protease family protein [Planctomycetales bacterium]